MIFHPPVLALILASALTSGLIVWASVFAVRLLRYWQAWSGSEAQLRLERQTYLVSTVLAFVMAVELASLILFVFNADRMAVMFVGAMCAVGTLNASVYGFPALFAKIAVFFAAGLWLAVNHADGKGRDYPLIRIKYRLLLGVAPLVLLAAGLQLAYFLDLKADTITSCCGKMFTPEKPSIAGELAGIGEGTVLILLYGALAVMLAVGTIARVFSNDGVRDNAPLPGSLFSDAGHPPGCLAHLERRLLVAISKHRSVGPGCPTLSEVPGARGQAGKSTARRRWRQKKIFRVKVEPQAAAFAAYGLGSAIFYAVALMAVVSVISLYVYEHPHHHCPFCLLKREYGYFGFLLYAPLFAGTVFGLSASFLGVACRKPSLQAALPPMLRRFVLISMVCFGLFGILAAWAIASSKLVLFA